MRMPFFILRQHKGLFQFHITSEGGVNIRSLVQKVAITTDIFPHQTSDEPNLLLYLAFISRNGFFCFFVPTTEDERC